MDHILEDISGFVSRLLNENLPDEIGYHDLLHTKEVTSSAFEIGMNSGLSKKELDLVQIAAWFHDTGFINKYKGHEQESIRIAMDFLKSYNLNKEDLDVITNLIRVTEHKIPPGNKLEEVIKDADILNIGQDAFFSNNERIKEEREQLENIVIDEKEWLLDSLNFIKGTNFYTDYAKRTYGEKRKENIEILTKRLNGE
ncbi:MAG: HD domain-containing protein [Methanococcaceae archaeon]